MSEAAESGKAGHRVPRRYNTRDAEKALDIAAASARSGKAWGRLREQWPAVYEIALRYAHYVTPLIEIGNTNVLTAAVPRALDAFWTSPDPVEGLRNFVEQLVRHAAPIARCEIAVQNGSGAWVVWTADEPLGALLARHRRRSVQITRNEAPFSLQTLQLKLVSYICTAGDLASFPIDLAKLLESSQCSATCSSGS